MSFQTRKTFVHLRNTNEDIFDEFWELSDPPIDIKDPNTIKVQKCSKDIVKIILTLSLLRFWYLIVLGSLMSMGGSESSQNSSKISSFVSQRWTKVLRVWNDMRVSY